MTLGSKVNVFRIGPTARNMNLCSLDRGSKNASYLYKYMYIIRLFGF